MIGPMRAAVLGADPGLSGGLAFMLLDDDGSIDKINCVVTPTKPGAKTSEVDGRSIAKLIDKAMEDWDCDIKLACVEIVHAFKDQGVTSCFNFGKGYGRLLGVLEAMAIPIHEVTPQRWKKVVLDGLGREKDDAIRYCLSHFPDLNLKRTERCIKFHDGMAEAVCIAEFGRQQFIGSSLRGMTLIEAGIVTDADEEIEQKLAPPAAGWLSYHSSVWTLQYKTSTGRLNTLELDSTEEDKAKKEAAKFLSVKPEQIMVIPVVTLTENYDEA